MRIIKTVLLDRDEAQAIHKANRLIDIGFPLASDPLVQRSTDALSRAVKGESHPLRIGLNGLRNAFDPITQPRLATAQQTLTILLDQVIKESDADHWLGLAADPTHPQARQMAEVLAAERTGQQRHVREALDIVTEALSHLSEDDDPKILRDQKYADI